jgi:hypothetical protein
MAQSAPCSDLEASLIGARISLFAKLGNLGHKLLVWRDVGRADRQPGEAVCEVRCKSWSTGICGTRLQDGR